MKKVIYTIAIILSSAAASKAQQGFGTSTPAPSAVIDMTATNKGALLPRVNLTGTTDVTTVPSPADALTVFNKATTTTGTNDVTPGYYYWSAATSKWVKILTANNGWQTTGNTGTTTGTNLIGSPVDGNYVGTADAKNLTLAAGGTKQMIIDPYGNAVGGEGGSVINIGPQPWGGTPGSNFVWGDQNTVDNSGGSVNGYTNAVFGFLNKSTAANSAIFGFNNQDINPVQDEGYNFIAGADNTIEDAAGSTGASSNRVLGSGNVIHKSSSNFIGGSSNTINALKNNSYVLGENNVVNNINAFAIGFGVTTTADNQFAAKFSNGYRFLGIGSGPATDNLVSIDNTGLLHQIAPPATVNIYNTDGTLTGNRVLTLGGNALQFYNAASTGTTSFTGDAASVYNSAAAGRANIQLAAGTAPSVLNMYVDGGSSANIITGNATAQTPLNIGTGTGSATPINFSTNGTPKATITASGNVGIGTSTPNSTLQVVGSLSLPIKSVTADYTATANDYKILLKTNTLVTITLPDPTTCIGRMYVVQTFDTTPSPGNGAGVAFNYPISIGRNGVTSAGTPLLTTLGTKLGAAPNYTLLIGTAITLQSDGTVWTGITQ